MELTATKRVGFHKYTFPENAVNPSVIVDLINGIGWDAPVETVLTKVKDSVISGYRYSMG